jgi:hypothetical protein
MDTTSDHRGFTIVARALGDGPYAGSYEARPLDLQAAGPHFVGDANGSFVDAPGAEAAAVAAAKAAIDRALEKP